MQQINFNSGIQEFQINGGGVLRFNPSDLNVYSRFMNALEELRNVEDKLEEKFKALVAEGTGVNFLQLSAEADREVKRILTEVFGRQNDFDAIFGGVNVMTPTENGEMVITNFLNALKPVIEKGARDFAKGQAKAAKNTQNRAMRRAAAKKS